MCWGTNAAGEVGDGSTTSRPLPVNITAVSNISQVVSGWDHTCALTMGGAVKCWGANADGQLGTGNTMNEPAPADVMGLSNGVLSIAAGGFRDLAAGHQYGDSCAVLGGGTVECWGSNFGGKFGAGVPVAGSTPKPITGLTGIAQVALGQGHLCALDTAGAVHCLGSNYDGQLGDTTETARSSPVTPQIGVAGTTSTSIAAGDSHTCAVAQGVVWCWGTNAQGQLGIGNAYLGVAAPMSTVFSAVSVVAGADHTCALNAAGEVYCWGYNSAGQLGNGTTTNAFRPTQVVGLQAAASEIAAGLYATCAVLVDGRMACWGAPGGLGDGSGMQQNNPVIVSGL